MHKVYVNLMLCEYRYIMTIALISTKYKNIGALLGMHLLSLLGLLLSSSAIFGSGIAGALAGEDAVRVMRQRRKIYYKQSLQAEVLLHIMVAIATYLLFLDSPKLQGFKNL